MNKHTPGPWNHCQANPLPKKAKWLAITSDHKYTHAYILDDEEGEANARLIAAAPTMYSYIKNQAEKGDSEAVAIIKKLD